MAMTDIRSKPGRQVCKPWCLLSSNLVDFGNPGGGGPTIFQKGP
jgi:hypothetical protein